MKEFIELNKGKLTLGFLVCSVFFTAIFFIVLVYNLFKFGQWPEIKLASGYFLACSVLFPAFVTIIRAVKGFQHYKSNKGIMQNYPFSELAHLGFDMVYTHKENRFKLTQLKLIGNINGYPIGSRLNKMVFTLSIEVDQKKLNFEHVKMLQKEIGGNKVGRNWYGIDLNYDFFREWGITFEQINTDLNRITELLQRENVNPPSKQQ